MIRATLLPFACVLAIAGILLSSCSAEWNRDAPRAAVDETSPARVIQMPDSSIYHYSSSEAGGSYGALSVVADPACLAVKR